MKNKILISLIVLGSFLIGFIACSKDNNKNATLKVRLTDAPADYQQVLLDIQDVQIHASANENEGAWVSLPIKKGIYNLLDFRNGLDTLLATVELPAGTISQMRVVLGSANQLKVNDQLKDLTTPSAQQSGLKFNINAVLEEGVTYQLWIDFDAARSIVAKGNGTYSLKPVIRTFNEATSGAIKGLVTPLDATPLVKAIANGDTLTTIAGADGKFLIRGVNQGTYKVVFEPTASYTGKTVENVSVTTGQVTNMGTISF
ncbi:MAG: DUF4382 domain-containing protein [Sphingobacteriaceae bacterium]